jgi:hypothetical protein
MRAGKIPLDTAAASPLTYVLVVLELSTIVLDRKMDLALAPGEFVTRETMTMLFGRLPKLSSLTFMEQFCASLIGEIDWIATR